MTLLFVFFFFSRFFFNFVYFVHRYFPASILQGYEIEALAVKRCKGSLPLSGSQP